MVIDAIVLAGGRSTRLGEVPKASLRFEQHTLLERAVAAVHFARRIVVVGDAGTSRLPSTALLTREHPPFGGPAAAIAAGLESLREALAEAAASAPSDTVLSTVSSNTVLSNTVLSKYVIVIACDMPRAAAATSALRDALRSGIAADGVIAIDREQRPQPLAAAYSTAHLMAAVVERERIGSLSGLSAFRLIDGMTLTPLAVPTGSTDDVDTWDDAARFGIEQPQSITV